MKNECIYKVAWVIETVGGIDRGEKEFETSTSAYAFADNIKRQKELLDIFIIRKLELTVINTYSLI